MSADIHLIEGPVGAGKSTFATRLALSLNAIHLDLDQWMVTLFSPDRPEHDFFSWYEQCKRRTLEQIWSVTQQLQDADVPVVLELGLVQAADRAEFYARVDSVDARLHVYVIDAPLEVRRDRVRKRNQEQSATFKMTVSDEIFALANAAWQPPDDMESLQRDIEFVSHS